VRGWGTTGGTTRINFEGSKRLLAWATGARRDSSSFRLSSPAGWHQAVRTDAPTNLVFPESGRAARRDQPIDRQTAGARLAQMFVSDCDRWPRLMIGPRTSNANPKTAGKQQRFRESGGQDSSAIRATARPLRPQSPTYRCVAAREAIGQ
jgi:hypothetical protein